MFTKSKKFFKSNWSWYVKQTLIAKPLDIVGHNEQLAYLEVAFDLNYKNGSDDFWAKNVIWI